MKALSRILTLDQGMHDNQRISMIHENWPHFVISIDLATTQVFAPTFPGYGRSEKQALAYSQELWRDFLRDFVLEVVQRPVVVAGNSIGGFISASLAADYPSLVKGEPKRILKPT